MIPKDIPAILVVQDQRRGSHSVHNLGKILVVSMGSLFQSEVPQIQGRGKSHINFYIEYNLQWTVKMCHFEVLVHIFKTQQ